MPVPDVVGEQKYSKSLATFSGDRLHRYRLDRFWGIGDYVVYVMLNPSTADEVKNDPTVERCERRARMTPNISGFVVVNIFALRSTDPRALYKSQDPIGVHNDDHINVVCRNASLIICAWGTHGGYLDRGKEVHQMITRGGREVHCLGVTKAGHPKHPLYIGYDVKPAIYEGYP